MPGHAGAAYLLPVPGPPCTFPPAASPAVRGPRCFLGVTTQDCIWTVSGALAWGPWSSGWTSLCLFVQRGTVLLPSLCLRGWDTLTLSFPTRAQMPPDIQTSRELPISVVLTLTFSSCQPIGEATQVSFGDEWMNKM